MEKLMTLEEVRARIDVIDEKIHELIMERLACSLDAAKVKQASGSLVIYRPDRESQILDRLGSDVPEDVRTEYLAVVRKIMETSRMYQYGLLYDWNEGLFEERFGDIEIPDGASRIRFCLTRPNRPNAMSQILSMIGDYGCNMESLEFVSEDKDAGTVTFVLMILGDLHETHMKKLMFQLSMESEDFRILRVE